MNQNHLMATSLNFISKPDAWYGMVWQRWKKRGTRGTLSVLIFIRCADFLDFHNFICKILRICAQFCCFCAFLQFFKFFSSHFCIFLLIFARLCVFLHLFFVLIFRGQGVSFVEVGNVPGILGAEWLAGCHLR